ncbi:hypothetical protein KUTeg_001161 [Tegillarca granosa]|uniref:Uncharacterized protein n=1 Tax=Tegillarca granosa TaxID=220873 RepID=A0ABQ9FVM9_TEGGR|nr:hypothetical protein KUTeg_001161 [Tegillarca granosa]
MFDADGFLVDAKIIDPGYPAVADQEFHSFMFPGYLAGTTFTYNKYGLLYTANRLYQNQNPLLSLIPSALFLRDVIKAKNATEAYALTTDNVNIFSLALNVNFYDTTDRTVFNAVEWAITPPVGSAISSSDLVAQNDSIYYHFNRFKLMTPTTSQTFYDPLSTEYREANVALFLINGVPSTFDEVKSFVSNEEFSEFPHYRAVEKYTDHVTTFNS